MNEEHMAPIQHLESSEERVRTAQRNQARIDGAKIPGWNQPVVRNLMEGLVHSKAAHLEIQARTVQLDAELEQACSNLQRAVSDHRRVMGALRDSTMRLWYAEAERKWALVELENRNIARLSPMEAEARSRLAEKMAQWLSLYEGGQLQYPAP